MIDTANFNIYLADGKKDILSAVLGFEFQLRILIISLTSE